MFNGVKVRERTRLGAGSDYVGADLRVIFEWLGIQEQRTCVVQVKSFARRECEETKVSVDQIRKALHSWDADMGIIVSTASSSSEKALDKALDRTAGRLHGKPVSWSCYIGEDVAAFK